MRALRPLLGIATTGLILACLACSSSSSGAGDSKPGKYEQTWPKPVTQTSCTDWTDRMNDHERFVMAHQVLGYLDAPNITDELTEAFQADVTDDCSASTSLHLGVDEVAALLAESNPQYASR